MAAFGHCIEAIMRRKLYGRLHKCDFIKEEVEYLGFRISKEGISTDPEKIHAVV